MAFDVYAYAGNDGEIYRIRLQAATAAAGDFTSQVGFTSSVFAKVSKTNREFGIRPRGVRLVSTAAGEKSYRFLPCATQAAVDGLVSAGTVSIGGTSYRVTAPVAEDY